MSRTRVQQTQISGSLSYSDNLAAGSALAGQATLVGDLNALRSQLNKIIGVGNWYDALSGSQDLADIYGAMQVSGVDAAFQGDVSAVGDMSAVGGTFSGNISAVDATLSGDLAAVDATLSGDLSAVGGTFSGNISAVDGTFSGDLAAVDATLSGDLSAVGGTFSGNIAAVDATLSGDLAAVDATLSGDLSAVGGTFSGNIAAVDATLSGDLAAVDATLSGDLSAVGGTFSGNIAAVDGTFSGDLAAVDATLSGDLSAVGGTFSGNIAAVDATFSGDLAAVDGTFSGNLSAVDATLSGNLSAVSGSFSSDVSVGAKLSISGDVAQRLYIVDADGSIKDEAKLTFDGSELYINGDLKVGGNDIKSSTDDIAIALSGADVAVKGDLTVEGNEIKSTTGTVMELSGLDAIFKANVQVNGDLRVKGSMTYIDTQNMRVEDAFIYLATGSAGTSDSGIVLHGGAGVDMDLVIGQDGGAGEVIFGKGNRAPDGNGAMNGIELVPAWMSEIKLGGVEGSLSGSFAIEGNNMKLEAANDLSLAANGESVGLMSAAEYTLFDSNFTATSIVGALNELYAAGAGGSKKGDLSVSNVSANVLDFSSVGTLNSAGHQYVDVYLNGVLLSSTVDLSSLSTTSVELDSGIASSLTNDDVITVILRGAA